VLAGASWAFAAAAAFESAWAITHNSTPPLVSRQQFLDCTGATPDSCLSGHPGDAFEYAAGLSDVGARLVDAVHYQYLGTKQGLCTADLRVRREKGERREERREGREKGEGCLMLPLLLRAPLVSKSQP